MTPGFSREFLLKNNPGIIEIGDESPFKPHLLNGKLFVDVEIWNRPNKSPIRLVNDTLYNLPDEWDENSTNEALEIVNEDTIPIFQFIHTKENHFTINGLFLFRSGSVMLAREDVSLVVSPLITDTRVASFLHLERIFKYPGWKSRGQLTTETDVWHDQIKRAQINQRWINPSALRQTLSKFHHVVVYLSSIHEYEAERFSEQLGNVLRASSWDIQIPRNRISPIYGVDIYVGSDVPQVADELNKTLNENGILASINPQILHVHPKSLWIWVGFNPGPEITKSMQKTAEYVEHFSKQQRDKLTH